MRLTVMFTMLGLAASAVQAQTPAPPPPRHEGSGEFAYVGTGGNSETESIGLAGELIYRPTGWETRVKATYIRNESDDQIKAQSVDFVGRAQREITAQMSGYSRYEFLRDRFAGILERNTIEAGLVFAAINASPNKLSLDAGFGYANEQRLVSTNLSTGTAGAGAIYALKISETSDLTEDAHFLFSLSEGRDWRFANTAAVTAKINSLLSLKLSNGIRYVRTPVVGFKSTDMVTSIALVAKF